MFKCLEDLIDKFLEWSLQRQANKLFKRRNK